MFAAVIALLTLLAAAGLAGGDARVVAASKKWRGRSRFCEWLFALLSFQPVVATVLFLGPAAGLLLRGQAADFWPLLVAPSLALGLAFLGKYLFRRPRPLGHITYIGRGDSAFPSAHAAGSFAAAGVLAVVWPSLAAVWLGLAAGITFSRLFLQVHFLSDLAAGTALGLLAARFTLQSNFLFFLQKLYYFIF